MVILNMSFSRNKMGDTGKCMMDMYVNKEKEVLML
jgi:hypothetical protein